MGRTVIFNTGTSYKVPQNISNYRERERVQCSAAAKVSFKHFMEYGSDEQ